MGTLYLVRHGQASFGADNYDKLSALGWQQSRRLGEYFRERGHQFDAVITGTLQRHAETWQGIREGMGIDLPITRQAGLNEYDSEAVIQTVHPEPLQKPDSPEMYRHHFRLLRAGLSQWMEGRATPQGMPDYVGFRAGVVAALDWVRTQHSGNVLLVSSGGPIATAVGHILGTSAETTIELNFHIRNSAVSEFKFNPKGHRLISYNTLNHLDGPAYKGWTTFT